jgi:hypothetical protein
MNSEGKTGAFKVEDKRLFNPDGSTRVESASSNPTVAEEVSSTTKADENFHEEVNLASFVMSLATQGMMQMGEMKVPDGYPIPVDKVAAKQTIDLIALLREKTKGNTDKFEDQLFEEVLHSLRMAFVKNK